MKTNLQLFVFLSLILLVGCIKDMEMNPEQTTRKVVVNALFDTENPWSITLNYSKPMTDSIDFQLTNAIVRIEGDNGEKITLSNAGHGIYNSTNKPQVGVNYTLFVEVERFPLITAKSKIPETPKCKIEFTNPVWTKYMYPNDLMDYTVFPLTISFDQSSQEKLYRVRSLTFNPRYGYIRYMFPSSSIPGLEKKGMPKLVLDQLRKVADLYFLTEQVIYDCANGISDLGMRSFYQNQIHLQVMKQKVNYRHPDAFQKQQVFSISGWLNNISYDTVTLMGKNEFQANTEIYVGNMNLYDNIQKGKKDETEYWVEIIGCSEEFYHYNRTYILQVSQRINPYAEPVQVYSNINNGIGIFAGYSRQMIHFYDY